jgi:hypothetical protein
MKEGEPGKQPIPEEIRHLDVQGNEHLKEKALEKSASQYPDTKRDGRRTAKVLLWSQMKPNQEINITAELHKISLEKQMQEQQRGDKK